MANHFFGRDQELKALQSIWKQARDCKPQVVNYIADTGVGKTRLIQAFYEWLSTDPEQGDGQEGAGYWPDDLGTGRQRVVNPSLDRFKQFDLANRRIPWLWWGMYWTDAKNDVRTAFVETSSYLKVHLEVLEVNRSRDKHVLETLRDVAADQFQDVLKDGLKGIAGTAVPIIGSGVVDLGFALTKLVKTLVTNSNRSKEVQLGSAAGQESKLEALSNELLDRLKKHFDDSKRKVPMVLFLDDIHFATDVSQDDKTLQFLDSLLRQASLFQWPLLVITTHWKAPWQAHLHATMENAKPWRRIEEALVANPNHKGRIDFYPQILDPLDKEHLRQVALDHLPGLSGENLAVILAKVDNVRWLVELLKAVSDNNENFIDNNRGNALSPLGLSRLDQYLSHQGYLGVIRQRLQGDAMQDIRQVLGATAWHACGLDFVGPLAEAFESRLIEQKLITTSDESNRVVTILMQALNPASLIEGQTSNGQLTNLIRFPERGYLEVARELFDKSQVNGFSRTLGQRVIEWMEPDAKGMPRWLEIEDQKTQKVFLGIAVEVLGRLQPHLSDEQLKELEAEENALRKQVVKGRLTEEEFKQEYQDTKDALLAKSPDFWLDNAGKYQALAMAELVALLYKEGHGQAWGLAYELAEHSAVGQIDILLQSKTRLAVLDIWAEKKGCWALARLWLQSAVKGRTEDGGEASKAAVTVDLDLLAKLDVAAGYTDAARQKYEQSLSIHDDLLAQFGPTPERLRNRTIALFRLADLDVVAGNTDAARLKFDQSLAVHDDLLAQFGPTPERLRDRTIVLGRLAYLDVVAGNTDAARLKYEQSLVIEEDLVAQFGSTPQRLQDKAVTLSNLANLDLEAGNTDAARLKYEQSLVIEEDLLAQFGSTPQGLQDKAVTLSRLADLDVEAGNTDAARLKYEQSLVIREDLLAQFGSTPKRLQGKEVTLSRLTDLDVEAGNTDAARLKYEQSLAEQEVLLAQFGPTPERLRDRTIALFRLANLDMKAGNTDAARLKFKQSLAIQEDLLAQFGSTPERLRERTMTLERLADLDVAAGNTDAARLKFEQSLVIREDLLVQFGSTPERLRDRTITLERLADLDVEAGNTVAARLKFEQSLVIQEDLLAQFGSTPQRLQDKAVTLSHLAYLDVEAGNTDAARLKFEQSLVIREDLLAQFGSTPELVRGRSFALFRLANLDVKAGNTDAARLKFEQSLVIHEDLLARFDATPERMSDELITLSRLADLDVKAGNTDAARLKFEKIQTIQEVLFPGSVPRLRDKTRTFFKLKTTTCTEPPNDDLAANVQYPEGFARVTRYGEADIYLIQNMNPSGGYAVSYAFDLDDFDPGKNVGNPLMLQKCDVVEHLGAVMEYMAPASPLWELIAPIVRAIPRDCGLLPVVRAVEQLRHLKETPSAMLIQETIAQVLADYYCRRAKLP